MGIALIGERKVHIFNVIDDCNREALIVDVGISYLARAVIETLENLREEVRTLKYIRCDNGP